MATTMTAAAPPQLSPPHHRPKHRNSLVSYQQNSSGSGCGYDGGHQQQTSESGPPELVRGGCPQQQQPRQPGRRSSLFGSLTSSSSRKPSRVRSMMERRGSISSLASTATGDSSVRSFVGNLRGQSLDRLIEKKKWKKVAKKLETAEGRAEAAGSSMSARWSDSVGGMILGMSLTSLHEGGGGGASSVDEDPRPGGVNPPPAENAAAPDEVHDGGGTGTGDLLSVVSLSDEGLGAGAGTDHQSDENVLHRACFRSAPLSVVRLLCESCPDLAAESDDRGRTALHLAAADAEVYPETVHYLLGYNGGSAFGRDADGRLPLHAACRRPPRIVFGGGKHSKMKRRSSWSGGSSSAANDPFAAAASRPARILSLTVVRLLYDAAPHAVNAEDGEGLIPAEHVLMAGGCGDFSGMDNVRVLEYLLRKSRKVWEARIKEDGESAERERESWSKRRTRSMRCAMVSDEKGEAEARMSLNSRGAMAGGQMAALAELRRSNGPGGGFAPQWGRFQPHCARATDKTREEQEEKEQRRGAPEELVCDRDGTESSLGSLGFFDTMASPDNVAEVERKMEELAQERAEAEG